MRPRVLALFVAVGVAACSPGPERTLESIERAMEAGDADAFERWVDLDAVVAGWVDRVAFATAAWLPPELTTAEVDEHWSGVERGLYRRVDDAVRSGGLGGALLGPASIAAIGLPAGVGGGFRFVSATVAGDGDDTAAAVVRLTDDSGAGQVDLRLRLERFEGGWRLSGVEPTDELLERWLEDVPVEEREAWGIRVLLRASMLELMADQGAHRRSEYQYAADAERTGWRPRGGVRVQVLAASELGWAAVGGHPDLAERGCALFVGGAFAGTPGLVTRGGERPGRSREIVCD